MDTALATILRYRGGRWQEQRVPRDKRIRHTDEFKAEALSLAETVGVRAAARPLNLHESQIYDWRAKARVSKTNAQLGQAQAVEIARLKRQLAEQAEELALLKRRRRTSQST
jgi:transposase